MGFPTFLSFVYRRGVNPTPTNDTDPVVGALGPVLAQNSVNQLFDSFPTLTDGGGPDFFHYSGMFVELNEGAGGSIQNGFAFLSSAGRHTGLAPPVFKINNPTAANTGKNIRIVSRDGSGDTIEEVINLAGVGDFFTAATPGDNEDWFAEVDDLSPIAGSQGVDDITISVGTRVLAKMWAPSVGADSLTLRQDTISSTGAIQVGTIYNLSLCNAFDEGINETVPQNRTQVPDADSGMTGFFGGGWVPGEFDERIALPGLWADGSYIGIGLRKRFMEGIPSPGLSPFRQLQHIVSVIGEGLP